MLLLRRFQVGGATADLTAALNTAASAVTAYLSQHSAVAGAALNLGSAYRTTFDRHHDVDDATSAQLLAGRPSSAGPG